MMSFRKFLSLLMVLALLLCGCKTVVTSTGGAESQSAPDASGNLLSVHFIDVGQADCALLECGEEFMLIDGGNVADSDLVVSYLEDAGVEELRAVVGTHAHEDHVGGLAGVLAVFPTEAVYAPTRTYSSRCFDDFMYYVNQQDLTVQIPQPGDHFMLGSAEVTVLGPVKSYAETNDTSIVLMVQFGETRFLFTGDMEQTAENDMLDYGADVKADVLKVGHHGSSTSTGYRFLYEVDPEYAVISVGEGNTYGHPNEEVLSRLKDADVSTFRTDELGNILAVSDGETITFTWEKEHRVPENTEEAETVYIGNKNSKKFHLPSCGSLPAEKNRIEFNSYEEAVQAGYEPCGQCMK